MEKLSYNQVWKPEWDVLSAWAVAPAARLCQGDRNPAKPVAVRAAPYNAARTRLPRPREELHAAQAGVQVLRKLWVPSISRKPSQQHRQTCSEIRASLTTRHKMFPIAPMWITNRADSRLVTGETGWGKGKAIMQGSSQRGRKYNKSLTQGELAK